MTNMERRYDIDWLRVIAIGLLLIYHIGIGFQPWGVFIQFIQSNEPLSVLWTPMSMLNIWRIPLLFFVSGMGVCFALRKRNWKQLIGERSKRILLPYIFGIAAVVPIHIVIWQAYYMQDIAYAPHPSHLWFLGYIYVYVLVLSPLFFYLKKNENGWLHKQLGKLFSSPLGIFVIMMAFVIEAVLLKPEIYEAYALSIHGFLLGLMAFFFGFLCIYSGIAFWKTVQRWRWGFLALAVGLFTLRLVVFNLIAPIYLLPVESVSWIMAVFGLGYSYLNLPGKALKYLSEAAYPVYIIHMVFLYAGSYLIMPLNIPVIWQFILVTLFTIIGCFVFYEFIIRRIPLLRPLFGLKTKRIQPEVTEKDSLALKVEMNRSVNVRR